MRTIITTVLSLCLLFIVPGSITLARAEVYRRIWQPQLPAQTTTTTTTTATAMTQAASTTGRRPTVSFMDIDNERDMTRWERYVEGPKGFRISALAGRMIDPTAPSGDGRVFHMGIAASSSYANVYQFQRKPLIKATHITYGLKFKWASDDGLPPQALEFPFSLYTGSQRLEAAMQWVAGDGRGARWRVWGGPQGGGWTDADPAGRPWRFAQSLAPNTWHDFSMSVSIEHGQVYYHAFTVDDQTFTINARYAGSADSTEAQTVIAFQIDNTVRGTRQDVWLDDLTLSWQP